MGKSPPLTEEQIFSFYVMPEPNSGCWLFTGPLDTDGYGIIQQNGKRVSAPRTMYTLRTGAPPKHNCCHKCDTPSCVNPDHLFDGTQLENMQDASRKGRMRGPRRIELFQIKEMTALYRAGNLKRKEIAAQYGISIKTLDRYIYEGNGLAKEAKSDFRRQPQRRKTPSPPAPPLQPFMVSV